MISTFFKVGHPGQDAADAEKSCKGTLCGDFFYFERRFISYAVIFLFLKDLRLFMNDQQTKTVLQDAKGTRTFKHLYNTMFIEIIRYLCLE